MKNNVKNTYIALLAIIVWFGIGLQFYTSTLSYLAKGRTFAGSILQIFSYFTIQSNILVALSLTFILLKPSSAWGRFFSKLSVLTAITVYITITGSVYALVLRQQFHPQGLAKLANEIVHTGSPILYVLFWILFVQKYKIQWVKVLNWLIYPLIYLVYVLIRGAVSGLYPYSFIDATKISYQQIFINSVFLLLAFLGVGAAFVALSRLAKKG